VGTATGERLGTRACRGLRTGTLSLDDARMLVAGPQVTGVAPNGHVIPIRPNKSEKATTVLELSENCLQPHAFLAVLAEAHVHGASVQWRSMFAGTGVRRVDLPTYAFQRERYWLEDGGWRGGVAGT
jgi:acyl transferase domain-containing protein